VYTRFCLVILEVRYVKEHVCLAEQSDVLNNNVIVVCGNVRIIGVQTVTCSVSELDAKMACVVC
jgi:hypothetical protein